MAAATKTPSTSGRALAADTSIDTMRAWATGERTNTTDAASAGRFATNLAPRRKRSSSTRCTGSDANRVVASCPAPHPGRGPDGRGARRWPRPRKPTWLTYGVGVTHAQPAPDAARRHHAGALRGRTATRCRTRVAVLLRARGSCTMPIVIANLGAASAGQPTDKTFVFGVRRWRSRLALLGVDAVTLASNHSLDYGRNARRRSCTCMRRDRHSRCGHGRRRVSARARRRGPARWHHRVHRSSQVRRRPVDGGRAFADLDSGSVPHWITDSLCALDAVRLIMLGSAWSQLRCRVPPARSLVRRYRRPTSAHVFTRAPPVLFDLGGFIDDYTEIPYCATTSGSSRPSRSTMTDPSPWKRSRRARYYHTGWRDPTGGMGRGPTAARLRGVRHRSLVGSRPQASWDQEPSG
jgi:hypothetical protein